MNPLNWKLRASIIYSRMHGLHAGIQTHTQLIKYKYKANIHSKVLQMQMRVCLLLITNYERLIVCVVHIKTQHTARTGVKINCSTVNNYVYSLDIIAITINNADSIVS